MMSGTGTGLIHEIIAVTSRLLELMDREVEYLRTGRVNELTPLQRDKLQLIGAYETQLARLREEPSVYGAVAPTLKEELEAATGRLDRAIDRNMKALQAAREINRRLMDAVVEAAADDRTPGRGYARSGAAARDGAPPRRRAVSITLDQRL